MKELIFTRTHKDNISKAAFAREAKARTKISINGVIYDNVSRAAAAVGLHQRTITRYAQSDKEIHKDYFFIQSTEEVNDETI